MSTKPTETIAIAEFKATCLAVLERMAQVPGLTLVTADARLTISTEYAVLAN